ncbi:MAG TPA: PAS domain S-box protein [Solirubrobacterales bacterium]|nr:PAS domain S-box protein [Solirubrobacterales bacterium]
MAFLDDDRIAQNGGHAIDAEQLVLGAIGSMPGMSVLVFDAEFRFRAVFGAAVRAHGHDPDQMIGRRAPDVLPAPTWERLAPLYARVTAGETFTEVVESGDRSRIYESTFSPVLGPSGPIGGMVMARDVTTERRALAALERSEQLHRMISEQSGDVVSRADAEGTYLYVSHAASRLYGWEPEQMVGRSAFEYIHPEDLAATRAGQAELIGGASEEITAEYRMRCADGRYLWVEGRVKAVRDEAGKIVGLQAATRDIGARRQTEAELRQAKEMFELAFSAAPIGMALFDPEGRWLRVNAALGTLVGRDRHSLLATSLPEITHPADREADRRLRRQLVEEGGESCRVERRLLHASGQTVRARLCLSLVRNPDGSPRWFIGQFEELG